MDSIHFVHSWTKQKFERIKLLKPEQVNSTIDEYVWIVRYLPYALCAAGLFVSLKAIKSTSKFTDPNQIPGAFVRKNAELRGQLVNISLDGSLSIEHSPIINLPWNYLKRSRYLDVRFAFIQPNISGIYWLKLNAIDKPVKFRIIDRYDNELFVSIILSQKPKLNLTEELILRGLATLQSETKVLNKFERKTYRKLEKLQTKAKKSGSGMWETDYKPSAFTVLVNYISKRFKNFILRK